MAALDMCMCWHVSIPLVLSTDNKADGPASFVWRIRHVCFPKSFQTQGMNLREYKTAQTPIMMLRSNFVMEK